MPWQQDLHARQGRFNPLPPIKEGVIKKPASIAASGTGFNPLPPIKEGVIGAVRRLTPLECVSILSLRLRRE